MKVEPFVMKSFDLHLATGSDHPVALAAPAPTDRPPARRILVLDDEESMRFLHTLALVREGYQVDALANGEQGWDALCKVDYNLVLTDHDMPRLTGLELVARMRQLGNQTPVIFVSGSAELAEACAARKLDVTALLRKSAPLSEMVRAVKRVVPMPPEWSAASRHQNFPVNAHPVFPLATAPHLDSFPPPAPRRAATVKRILVADDDAMVRAALCAVLESEDYAVDEAHNGIEAVTRAIEHAPDLVLLDLNMPHLDGWGAFSQLHRLTPLLPVIVITARPHQYPEAVRLGVDAFMEKPLNVPLLLDALQRLASEPPEEHEARVTSRTFVTRLLDSAVP